jgi:hypothetical protein
VRTHRSFAFAAALALLSAPAPAIPAGPPPAAGVDLTKVGRTIKKEPAYAGKPRYCLLVFGPRAEHKVWLVLDGDTLYVDRDGDGDLTGKDEKVKLPAMEAVKAGPVEAVREAKAGDVKEGRLTHTGLTFLHGRARKGFVPKTDDERELVRLVGDGEERELFGLHLSVDRGGRRGRVKQSAGEDVSGLLRFSARAEGAPVVHFNGPWSSGLRAGAKLALGDAPAELRACVGTPGLGKGTFATVVYEGLIPESAHPVAEVTFPAGRGGKPVTVRARLTRRC